MELQAVIVAGMEQEAAPLARMLREQGIACAIVEDLPAASGGTRLVFVGSDRLGAEGPAFVSRLHAAFPGALPVLLAPFAHQETLQTSLALGVWDALYLPLREDELRDLLERARETHARRLEAGRPREVLVVDDDPLLREGCCQLIRNAGHHAHAAADGNEALGRLASGEFDLVITDIKMPGMDGVALLARVRETRPDLPVVMTTGHATVESAVASLRCGALDFILKPFRAEDFLQVLERALRVGDLTRENRELEEQTRAERVRLRRKRHELRVLAEALASMSTATHPGEIAELWLRAAYQIVDFGVGAFFIARPEPELVVLPGTGTTPDAEEMRSGLAQAFPEILEAVPLARLRVRLLTRRGPVAATPSDAPFVTWTRPLLASPRHGAVLVSRPADAPFSPEETAFLSNLAAQAAQVLEKMRALGSEARLREEAMVAGMNQGVILADTEGRILVLNAAARETLALRREDEAGTLARLRAERDLPLDECLAELLRSGDDTLVRECLLRTPVERILTLELTAIRDEGGTATAVVTLLRDITELRETERMKSEFVSIVSHEIRTPLTVIKNCNDLLLNRSAGAISPTQERFLGMTRSSVDRLTRLVNDLLDIGRIEDGRMPLALATTDIETVARETVREIELEQLFVEKRLSVSVAIRQAAPLLADPDRLKQVLTNLLHNAVKFSAPGGQIEITAGPLAAEALLPPIATRELPEPRPALLEIRVADRGSGIPEEDLERIFDRFQQLELTLRREQGGIGLGLPISRGIIRSHGGAVWAERRDGGGSVLHIVLPLERRRAGADKEEG